MYKIGFPSSVKEWQNFIIAAMLPFVITMAVKTRVEDVVDSIYAGTSE
jgi:hypothetical protein